MILTSDEYIAEEGGICPVCRNKELTYSDLKLSNSMIWRVVKCNNCRSKWEDVFSFSGYAYLTIDSNKDTSHGN